MGLGKVMDGLYQFCVWIMRLAYINILWVAFSLLGLVIFGVGPSTLAMFSVMRKWMLGEREIAIFPLFWKSYREEFIRSNIILIILAVVGWILYIDFQILNGLDGTIYTILKVIVTSLIIVYIFIFLVIFPVLAHYQFKTLEYFKYTFLIVLSSPIKMFLMVLGLCSIILFYSILPGMILFFAGSLFSIIIMYFTSTIFKKIDEQEVNPKGV